MIQERAKVVVGDSPRMPTICTQLSYLAHPPPSVPHCTVLILLLSFNSISSLTARSYSYLLFFTSLYCESVTHSLTVTYCSPFFFFFSLCQFLPPAKWDLFRNFSEQSIVHYYNEALFRSKLFLQTSNFSITSKLSYIHKLSIFPSHHSNFNQTFNFGVN